jgi:hypothetical protein
MSQSSHTPRVAVLLLNLFAQGEEAASLLGDLSEESFEVEAKSGTAAARQWYWRQTLKTLAHLFACDFRNAPWSTSALVIGGFLLSRFASSVPGRILSAVTDKYLFYWSNHFHVYMFLATDGMLISHIIASAFVGSSIALAAKGKELLAPTVLALVFGAMGLLASIVVMAKTADASFLWIAAVQSADSFAMVAGAAIVRMRRNAAQAQGRPA